MWVGEFPPFASFRRGGAASLWIMKKAIVLLFALVIGLGVYTEYRFRTLPSYTPETDVYLLAEEAGDRKVWWRNGHTGGSTNLDGISHTSLTDGDVGLVATISGSTVNMWWYVYDADSTTSEDSTYYTVIAPDSGTGRWLLCNVMGSSFQGRTLGDSYVQIQQANTPSSLTEGMIWYDTVDNRLEFYDGTRTVYIQSPSAGTTVGNE